MTKAADASGNRTMSASDTLLWTIGRDPILRTTIVAVLVLDRSPRWEDVRKRVEILTRVMPRLRCRAVPVSPFGWGRPSWVEDTAFDLDLHLRRMVAAPPATLRTALDLAQVMGTTAFDPELPLWEAVVVEGIEGDRAALLIKLHHAVVDGMGGIAVLQDLLDRLPEGGGVVDETARPDGSGAGLVDATDNGGARRPPAGLGRVLPTSRRLLGAAVHAVADPVGQVSRTRATVRSVGRLLAPAGPPLSPCMTGRSLGRHFEILDLSPERMHDTTSAVRCTLNDVFVAGILIGLRHYHHVHGSEIDRLRLLMPVNVRSESDPAEGNHFVPARFVLPIAADPARCLSEVHEVAESWKHAAGTGDERRPGRRSGPPARPGFHGVVGVDAQGRRLRRHQRHRSALRDLSCRRAG